MSRTLKFRVWSDYHKKFVINGGEFGISRLFEDYSMGLNKHFPRNGDYKMPHYASDYVIQQWTGLVDSTGKDIYEGDIVRHDSVNFPVNGVVEWISESNGYDYSGWTTSKAGWGDGVAKTTIVGNIFETPELQ